MCYYEIKADPSVVYNENLYIYIKVDSYTNTYIYINNGTSRHTAADQVTVGTNSGTEFWYKATTNVYMILVAYSSLPSASFTYELKDNTTWTVEEVVVEPVVNVTKNVTVVNETIVILKPSNNTS